MWCPVAKGEHLLVKVPPHEHLIKEAPSVIDPDSSKLQPYLLAAWQEGWVDPNTTWAILRPAASSVSLCGEGCHASACDLRQRGTTTG